MRKGFSLVELSIVLVILGLLVGGILAGKSLIRASELRGIVRQHQSYAAAIHAFRDKYFAIPGDMRNATSFWGSTACSVAATGTATCNGNGDGLIAAGDEGFRFWHHLANAGLIAGSYSGVAGPANATWDAIIGTNVPTASIANVGWSAVSIVYDNGGFGIPAIYGDIPSANYDYKINQLQLGREYTDYWTIGGFLKPEEMWNLDTKLDDGKPGTGILISTYINCNNATDQFVAATGTPTYNLSTTSEVCAAVFMPKGTGLQ